MQTKNNASPQSLPPGNQNRGGSLEAIFRESQSGQLPGSAAVEAAIGRGSSADETKELWDKYNIVRRVLVEVEEQV